MIKVLLSWVLTLESKQEPHTVKTNSLGLITVILLTELGDGSRSLVIGLGILYLATNLPASSTFGDGYC